MQHNLTLLCPRALGPGWSLCPHPLLLNQRENKIIIKKSKHLLNIHTPYTQFWAK